MTNIEHILKHLAQKAIDKGLSCYDAQIYYNIPSLDMPYFEYWYYAIIDGIDAKEDN